MAYQFTVTVMRPAEALSDGGQKKQPTTVLKDVPCSIKHLSGREVERARALWPEATHEVEMGGDPSKPLRTKDWLELPGLAGETRRLHIGDINDKQQNGLHLTLLCGENPR